MSIPVFPINGCLPQCFGPSPIVTACGKCQPKRFEIKCVCKKRKPQHKKPQHKKHKHESSCSSVPSSSSSCWETSTPSSSSSCFVLPVEKDCSSSSSSSSVPQKHHHHHHHHQHKKERCCNKVEIVIITPTVPSTFTSSAQTCGIGCAALSTQLLGILLAGLTPTAAALAAFVTNATAYVACRTAAGAGSAPDVVTLNAFLTYLATLPTGTYNATAQALAQSAYFALTSVCCKTACGPCEKRKRPCC